MGAEFLFYVALALTFAGLGLAVVVLGSSPLAEPTTLGLRGWKREQALAENASFGRLDPAVRLVAGWIRHLPLTNLRTQAERQLTWAGDYLGLDADSYFAYCLLNALIGAAGAAALVAVTSFPAITVLGLGVVAGYVQYSAVDEAMTKRRVAVNRNLPGTIDLLSLCVSAGLSFPQAIRHVVELAVNQKDPIVEEFGLVLRLLNLGHTRAAALESFARRVPTPEVRDFVSAVVQSDQKGTPLRDVLNSQASVLRDRRSTRAEEAAAKADVKLTVPMMLMMLNIMLMITGPMILKLAGNHTFGGG